MNQYERVIRILDDSIGGPDVGIAAHGAFWRRLKRDEFIATKVFNYDLVVVGDGASSNLVKALKGQAPFGKNLPNPPAAATMPRMPFGFDPVANLPGTPKETRSEMKCPLPNVAVVPG